MKRKFCFIKVIGYAYLSYDTQEDIKRTIEPLVTEWVELDDADPTFRYMMRPDELVKSGHDGTIVVIELLEKDSTTENVITIESLMEAAKAAVAKDKKRLAAEDARKKVSEEKKMERLKKKYEKLKSVFDPLPTDQK